MKMLYLGVCKASQRCANQDLVNLHQEFGSVVRAASRQGGKKGMGDGGL